MPSQALQYVCSGCGTVLESCQILDVASLTEECPKCGSQLSESLRLNKACEKREAPRLFALSDFVLTFGIKELDAVLNLTLGDRLCLVGERADYLLTRLCVRSMISSRNPYSKVIVVDAGNRSDPYLAVSFARQYGLEYHRVLRNFVVSRAFTIHQLAGTVIEELPGLVEHHEAKIVMINDITHMFVSDPQVGIDEGKRLVGEMMDSIERLPKETLVGISMRKSVRDYRDIIMPRCNKREVV